MDGIEQYRNKYQGQRAWIVGNGPSLDRTPLDRLAGEYAFGINRIGSKFDKTNWRPTFFICSTGYVADTDYQKDVLRAIDESSLAFISPHLKPILGTKVTKDVHWVELRYSASNYRHIEPEDDWWNPVNIENGFIGNFGTSAFGCSELLVYMGFNPIFLIGCDLGYKEFQLGQKDPNHFGEQYESGKFHRPQTIHDYDNARYILSHEIMKKQAKKMGVDIYNATLGGELEVYDRVDFFDVV